MKKYYVIYNLEIGEYLIPMKNSVKDTDIDVKNAGKWPTEELALDWLNTRADNGDIIFTILPVYIKHS